VFDEESRGERQTSSFDLRETAFAIKQQIALSNPYVDPIKDISSSSTLQPDEVNQPTKEATQAEQVKETAKAVPKGPISTMSLNQLCKKVVAQVPDSKINYDYGCSGRICDAILFRVAQESY
jgi:hypothetical protein